MGLREPRKNRVHNPHEKWCTHFALQLCGEVRTQLVFRQHLVVDASLYMTQQVDLWADLAPYLVGRDVLIEHFSDSVSGASFGTCREKIAHALKNYENIPRKNRGDKRSPCMVMLSHRRPDRLLRERGAFEPTNIPGMWVRLPLELGPLFLVVPNRLPDDPRYDWLRLTTRVPSTSEAFKVADTLMKESNLDTLKEIKLKETMMETIIDGKTPIDLKNEMIELKQNYAAALRRWSEQAKAAEEQAKASQEQAKASQEKAKASQEKAKAAEEKAKAAEEKAKAAEERKKAAEERKKAAEERADLMEAEAQKMKSELEELRRLVGELKDSSR